jgi:hypothetical protein
VPKFLYDNSISNAKSNEAERRDFTIHFFFLLFHSIFRGVKLNFLEFNGGGGFIYGKIRFFNFPDLFVSIPVR